MAPVLSPMQLKAYNQGVSHVIKAVETVGNVRLQGTRDQKWQALQLLVLVREELIDALSALAAVAPNHLAPVSRMYVGKETE